MSGASVGAPPDVWNPAEQNWGLPPLHPLGARGLGYRNFIELLQANMRYAGALRIDHALALQSLYWIPSGAESKDGAYVQYATDDLSASLRLKVIATVAWSSARIFGRFRKASGNAWQRRTSFLIAFCF